MVKQFLTEGKVFFLMIPLFIFLISFTQAAVDTNRVDDVFKLNDFIPYTKACINNGTYCSSSTTCNYTFFNLDNTIKANNVLATNIGANGSSLHQFNVTFNETGIYQVDMVCSDGTNSGATTFYAQVTGSGLNQNVGFLLFIILLSFGVILIGFYMQDSWLTLFGSFGLYFLGLYILFNGIAGVKDTTTTFAAGLITLGIGFYISARSAHEMIVG